MAETDARLSKRLARGEEEAFAELYDACAAPLLRYLSVRLASRDQAADVLQSAMLRAVKARRRFAQVDDPAAYLFRIARNEAARSSRRMNRGRQRPLTADIMADLADNVAIAHDDAETVAAALARLSYEDRELVCLKVYGSLTYREIAEVTGRPPATVATRYRRALDSLRPWFAKQYQEQRTP